MQPSLYPFRQSIFTSNHYCLLLMMILNLLLGCLYNPTITEKRNVSLTITKFSSCWLKMKRRTLCLSVGLWQSNVIVFVRTLQISFLALSQLFLHWITCFPLLRYDDKCMGWIQNDFFSMNCISYFVPTQRLLNKVLKVSSFSRSSSLYAQYFQDLLRYLIR